MADDNTTVGRTFLSEVLSKLPESVREPARAAFEAAEAAPALDLVGQGVKRQSDYSRAMNALADEQRRTQGWYDELAQWYADKRAALEDYDRLRLQGATPGTAPAPVSPKELTLPPGVMTEEEYQRRMGQFASEALGVVTVTSQLSARHLKEFGEVLDLGSIIERARQDKVDLNTAYQLMFKDRYDARAKDAEEQRLALLRKDIEAEVRKEYAQVPYPVRPQPSGVLDALRETDRPDYSPEAAAAEYEALVALKTGS